MTKVGFSHLDTDSKARLVLPKSFANSTVILEQISDTEIRVRRAKVVAEDDMPFEEESAIKISARDRERFVKALLKPPTPNAALKKAVSRHKTLFDDPLHQFLPTAIIQEVLGE